MDPAELRELIRQYKTDSESVYNTWFIGSEARLKAFRAIRHGVKNIAATIAHRTFGNDFKGSPLEVVLLAITEQKQVFEGAAHPFYWKPKLRIPDIYENEANQLKFGAFLEACWNATREEQIISEISRLSAANIKGLGPAVASIIYFLHPTIVPPFNTAIVNGFNTLFGDNKKLGSWPSYLAMREMILHTNEAVRNELSKDLGAFAGLLFEIGMGRLVLSRNAEQVLQGFREKAEKAAKARHQSVLTEQVEESQHTYMQYLLICIGRAMGYHVYVARNDRHRSYQGNSFAQLTIPHLAISNLPQNTAESVHLIDVIWLKKESNEIICAFEVEKSTSIYSGILRLEDLAQTLPECECHYYLVAPHQREKEVLAQMARPAFQNALISGPLAYIPFNKLSEHSDALCKFGQDYTVMRKIAHSKPQL